MGGGDGVGYVGGVGGRIRVLFWVGARGGDTGWGVWGHGIGGIRWGQRVGVPDGGMG